MPGARLRALLRIQANPISATRFSLPLSPLNARSTSPQSSPSQLQTWTLHQHFVPAPRAPFFTNTYWQWQSRSALIADNVVATGSLPLCLFEKPGSRSCILRPTLPGRTAIGRIPPDCIDNTGDWTTTTSITITTCVTKAKLAAQAIVVAIVAAVVTASQPIAARTLRFFVQGATRLTANLIVLPLHHSNLRRTLSSHTPSVSPSFWPPIRSHLSPSLPSSLLLPLEDHLATYTSRAQASLLQTHLLRPDPQSTVPCRRLLGGLPRIIFPTASHARNASSYPDQATVDAFANPRLATLSQQPAYPGASPDLEHHPVDAAALPQGRSPSFLRNYDPKNYSHQSPFRNRAASSAARRLPHLSAARLWNPTNSTPRLPVKTTRKRRPSTPPPPPVPLLHPILDPYFIDPSDPLGIGAGDYPLLTLPEQRQNRHSTANSATLQVDRNAEHRISLPSSLRHSYDGRRSADPSPTLPIYTNQGVADDKADISEPPAETRVTGLRKQGQSISNPLVRDFAYIDKAVMDQNAEAQARDASKDLERGPDVLPRLSNVSAGDGIGSAISSSNSSIMGEELPPDLGEEWGPQHPCFPHLNPHVPIDSPEYQNTRVIRIRRDWLLEGDLAPTFSNLYPEILDPAGLSEQEFRRIIDKLNGELVPIFSPYNWRNIVDGVLGLVTGWLWDDLGFTGVKARLKRLEHWIDQWNKEMEKTVGHDDISMAPRIISLRRTGYMTLDIQIPDPEIAPAPSTPAGSGHMTMERPAAVTA